MQTRRPERIGSRAVYEPSLALVLATPGHGGADMQRAHSLLREVLAQTALMTPSEMALAHIT